MQLTEKQKTEGWRIVKFSEIAKSVSKRVDPADTDLEVYVGLEHLDPDNLRITRRGVPSDVKGQKLLVKPGQIIFGKRRAYQRKVAVADFEGICSAHAMVLEAIPEAVVPEYLPFFMQSDMFMERAVAISEGSLSPTIKWKTLANQEFPLPPRPRQEEMLEVFEKIETINVCNQKSIEIIHRLKRAVMKNYLTGKRRLSSFNQPWKLLRLEELVDFHKGKLLPKSKIEKTAPFKCIHYGELFTKYDEEIKSIKSRTRQDLNKSFLSKSNDVLMPTSDVTPNGLAIASCVKEDDVVLGGDILILRPKANAVIDGVFLSHLIRFNKMEVLKRVTGTTVFHIYASDLKKIQINIPPSKEEQLAIIEFLDEIEQNKKVLESKVKEVFSIRKSYTNKCLNGEVA